MRVLITAGPTHEPIDAVRFLGNRSSGRMGMALASAFSRRGHETTLLLGPVPARQALPGVRIEDFESTADLAGLLDREFPASDLLVMAAAVADFRPMGQPLPAKLERGTAMSLELEPTPDLVAGLATRRRPGQRLVGFSLEAPEVLESRARTKLLRKGLDAIVANPLATMNAEGIEGMLLAADGSVRRPGRLGVIPKTEFAEWLADELLALPARSAHPAHA